MSKMDNFIWFVYFRCVCVLRCAHSTRSKYLIKIQYRLQNDRFVCMCMPVRPVSDQKPIPGDCLRDFEFKQFSELSFCCIHHWNLKFWFFINWRCHLTIYEHCGRSIDWKPIKVLPSIWATSMLRNGRSLRSNMFAPEEE